MIRYRVQYTSTASEELRELRRTIYKWSRSRRIANGYVQRIRDFCRGLALAPFRGEERVGGLRTIGFETSVSVVFIVMQEQRLVEIVGIFDHGRDSREAEHR